MGPGGEPGLWCETVQLDGGPHGLPTSQEGVGDRPVSHGERVVDGALTDQAKVCFKGFVLKIKNHRVFHRFFVPDLVIDSKPMVRLNHLSWQIWYKVGLHTQVDPQRYHQNTSTEHWPNLLNFLWWKK